jgi:hypothetical protein
MKTPRPRLALFGLVAAGVVAGFWFGTGRDAAPALGGGGTRSGSSMILAGPVRVESSGAGGGRFGIGKIQSAMDGVYWIDYGVARLYATIPSTRKTAGDAQLIRGFAERDLFEDFGLKPWGQARFLMETAALGGFGGGSALLVVIEAESRQVAAYQAMPRDDGDGQPQFERLQVVKYGEGSPPARPGEPIGASGTVLMQTTPDGSQAALEAVYWLDSDRDTTLRAVAPTMERTVGSARVLGPVIERDLAADFGLKAGSAPRFLLSPVSLGAAMQGAGVLAVVERTTRQVAAYRFPSAAVGASGRAELELVQVKPYVEGR